MATRFVWSRAALLCAALGLGLAAGCDDVWEKERDGQSVSIDNVPPAVKATIDRETTNGTVKEIDQVTRNGTTAYGVSFIADGKRQGMLVSENGSVMKRGVEDDDDD